MPRRRSAVHAHFNVSSDQPADRKIEVVECSKDRVNASIRHLDAKDCQFTAASASPATMRRVYYPISRRAAGQQQTSMTHGFI